MARNDTSYRRFELRKTAQPWFRKLSHEARRLYFELQLLPDCGLTGMHYYDEELLCAQVNTKPAALRDALNELKNCSPAQLMVCEDVNTGENFLWWISFTAEQASGDALKKAGAEAVELLAQTVVAELWLGLYWPDYPEGKPAVETEGGTGGYTGGVPVGIFENDRGVHRGGTRGDTCGGMSKNKNKNKNIKRGGAKAPPPGLTAQAERIREELALLELREGVKRTSDRTAPGLAAAIIGAKLPPEELLAAWQWACRCDAYWKTQVLGLAKFATKHGERFRKLHADWTAAGRPDPPPLRGELQLAGNHADAKEAGIDALTAKPPAGGSPPETEAPRPPAGNVGALLGEGKRQEARGKSGRAGK